MGPVSGALKPGTGRFELVMAAAISAIALAVYLSTVAPGITWRNLGADGGDLLTAAFTWGVPHPSGYPTYLVTLRLFSFIFPFGDEAFRGNMLSAFLAAASVGLVYLAALRLIALLPQSSGLPRWAPFAAAAVAALAVAVSRELWSQATITEVYALNAFFVTALLLGVLRLYERERQGLSSGHLRTFLAFALGVGLGNHLTLAFVALPFVVWSYFWSGGVAGARGRLRDVRVPIAFLAGLAIYVYAPIASAGRPLLNWGHPDTAEGFWWMISGSIYQDYAFGLEASRIPGRLIESGDLFLAQFGFAGLVLGLVGLTLVWEARRGFAIAGIASIALVAAYAIGYDTPDSFLYLIPAFIIIALWMGVGTAALLGAARDGLRLVSPRRQPVAWLRGVQITLVVAILAAVPGFSAFANFGDKNLHGDREASDFAEAVVRQVGVGSVIVASQSSELFSLWYQSYVVDPGADLLVVSQPHLQFDWYWDDIHRQAPDRIPAERPAGFRERVLAIVDYNLGVRPVYTVAKIPLYDREFTLVREGKIYRIEP